MGVRIIAAHCATKGSSPDLDTADRPKVSNFELLLRMLSEKKYEGLLFADISAVASVERVMYLNELLDNKQFHHRWCK